MGRTMLMSAVVLLLAASEALAVDPVISDTPAPAPSRPKPAVRRPRPRPAKPREEPETNSQRAAALAQKADATRLAGDVLAAETQARQALELDPDHANALAQLGCCLVIRGQDEAKPHLYAEAVRYLDRAIARQPGNAFAHRWLGCARLQMDDLDAAERSFKEALRLMPDSSVVWQLMASLRSCRGRYADAVACQKKCLELAPGDAVATAQLAYFLAKASHAAEARARIEEAKRQKTLYPKDVQADLRRAEAALKER